MGGLPEYVLQARGRLAEYDQHLRETYRITMPVDEVMRSLSELRDAVLIDLFERAVERVDPQGRIDWRNELALVALGGYALGEVCPGSDADLMLLVSPGAVRALEPLAAQFYRDVYDVGLTVGHSVRTAEEACRLAMDDAETYTSVTSPRLLWGSRDRLRRFESRLRDLTRKHNRAVIASILSARRSERARFGDTVYLLEPNVKRSPGGLRDLRLIRWLGFARFGVDSEFALATRHLLDQDDLAALQEARSLLLRLRVFLHVRPGRPSDVLSRPVQVELAERLVTQARPGMLPVECFMQQYFRATEHVRRLAGRLEEVATSEPRWKEGVHRLFGHRISGGIWIGPSGIWMSPRVRALPQDLDSVLELLEFAGLYDTTITSDTWRPIRLAAEDLRETARETARERFLSILRIPARLAESLRRLHEIGLLEVFVPDFARARGLLQFNQYHKYTVDEHCLLAVEQATRMREENGPLGEAYRAVENKHVLHLALLVHDLGKGLPQDHSEAGRTIARRTAKRLRLPREEREQLEFLVHRHLLMNHTALRRDIADEEELVRFAVEVGSPELLRMLYVVTAADLQAVGPDAWTDWKGELIEKLYARSMRYLSDEMDPLLSQTLLDEKRQRVERLAASLDPWLHKQAANLPLGYLRSVSAEVALEDLQLLRRHERREPVAVRIDYAPDTQTLTITVATNERVTSGIFHKLAGALSGRGLEILSAQIHTLADGLVLDRFIVNDPDFAGCPEEDRLEDIREAIRRALTSGAEAPPRFRKLWRSQAEETRNLPVPETRVEIDNTSSHRFSVIEVFAVDRPGLLYNVAETLFELGYDVQKAKIGTYLDQVVDVFYVTDCYGRKQTDQGELARLKTRLLARLREYSEASS